MALGEHHAEAWCWSSVEGIASQVRVIRRVDGLTEAIDEKAAGGSQVWGEPVARCRNLSAAGSKHTTSKLVLQ